MLPTGNVWSGDGAVTDLPVQPLYLDDIAFADKNGVEMTVKQMLDTNYTDGFVVLHQGAIVAERYGDGLEAHESHLLMSVTKSFAASLAGIQVERGLFSPDDLVTDIIPEVAGSAYDGALVRHVLDMTVGMDYSEDPMSDVALLDVAAGWRPYVDGVPDNLRPYIAPMRPAGEHGAASHYVSINTDLLGWILERTLGTDFTTLLSRDIWQPMGAEHDAYITLDRLGGPQTDGGLCVKTRDLARFGQLRLQDGVMNGRRIVPESWIRDFRENGDVGAWDRGNFAADIPGHHYRSKWYTDLADPHRPPYGIGIHGQSVFFDAVAGVVIAKHSTHPAPVDPKLFDDMFWGFKAIAHALSD
ncbi:MAG: serine hydrolase [Rhodospirillaceae bacterium]|nr:serine hydrolase [Rhodospirillaceae bacterium]|tara:strand:+ start:17615 stop:18685 length:1071 start_codon:yes stop_codon:yes gene_type:complete